MPRGVRKTLVDKLYDLARTVPVDDFVTACAEMYATSLKDNSSIKLHEIFGEMNVRAQAILRDLHELQAQEKATRKPKSLPLITKATTRKKPGPKPGSKRLPAKKVVARKRRAA